MCLVLFTKVCRYGCYLAFDNRNRLVLIKLMLVITEVNENGKII